jgi:D-alanyl-D-alanine dipeptidase
MWNLSYGYHQPQKIKHHEPSVQSENLSKPCKIMKKISVHELVCMNDFESGGQLRIELAYASPGNILFSEAIYRPEARLWLYKDLADIVQRAAALSVKNHGLRLVLYDGLRTVEAQERMLKTQRVRDNPQWLEEPRLLSPPGAGGHPRGMAIDVSLETMDGALLDMGTPFDFLAADQHPDHNPAHRKYTGHANAIYENRKILDDCMLQAAQDCGQELLPLPQEWWDFRFHAIDYQAFAPLHDRDLPDFMRLCD